MAEVVRTELTVVAKRSRVWPVVVIAVLAAAVACGGAAAFVPANTAAPLVVPDDGPTATPAPPREWVIEGMKRTGPDGGDTVVTIRYFSTASVTVTYDGRQPDESNFDAPLEHFTFRGVSGRGGHIIVARDTMGFEEEIKFAIGAKSETGAQGPNR